MLGYLLLNRQPESVEVLAFLSFHSGMAHYGRGVHGLNLPDLFMRPILPVLY